MPHPQDPLQAALSALYNRTGRTAQGLQNRAFGGPGADPSGELYGLQNRRRDEIRNRLSGPGAAYTPVGELSALKNALGFVEEDIEESPITAQADVTNARLAAMRAANQAGFTTPEEQSIYGRNIAEEKLRQPIELREMETEGARGLQRMQGQQQLELEQERQRGAADVADRYSALQEFLATQGPTGGRQITRFQMPSSRGGGSTSFTPEPPPVSPGLANSITQSRMGVAEAQEKFGADSPEYAQQKAAYDQAVANVFAQFRNIDPGIKDFAAEVSSNPRLANLPVDQLLSDPELRKNFELENVTPEELNQLNQLLLYARGLGQR